MRTRHVGVRLVLFAAAAASFLGLIGLPAVASPVMDHLASPLYRLSLDQTIARFDGRGAPDTPRLATRTASADRNGTPVVQGFPTLDPGCSIPTSGCPTMGATCENTCFGTCAGNSTCDTTCSGETCAATCAATCIGNPTCVGAATCAMTCTGPTCQGFPTCSGTCDTTCSGQPTCDTTCAATCASTCSGNPTCAGSITCDATCVGPTCFGYPTCAGYPTCDATCAATCSGPTCESTCDILECPRIHAIQVRTNKASVALMTSTSAVYWLERITNLTSTNWLDVGEETGNGGELWLHDTNDSPAKAYYRIKLELLP